MCIFDQVFSRIYQYLQLGMKTEWKLTKLSATIFVFIFFAEAETSTETPKMTTETNAINNGRGGNTERTRKQKWALVRTYKTPES